MIRNQWYAVLLPKELPKNKPVGTTRMGEKLVFWRNKDGTIGCTADRCCHRGVSLSKGKIIGKHIECPFHGFQYDVTGQVKVIPAIGKNEPVPDRYRVVAYPAREAHGFIWIWWGEPRENYPPIPFFEGLDKFHYHTVPDYWNAHYSRVIENQLDVVHLPFVHHNTIGRGNKTLINGPVAKWDSENNLLSFWVFNQKDDGKTNPRQAKEIPDAELETAPVLHFKYPNVWLNDISKKVKLVAAFTPVDENNTILYLRTYHKIRMPGLSRIFNWIMKRGNLTIAHQDRRVVVTQEPKKSSLKSDEKLIQGDLPIIIYRRHRQELMDKNIVQ
ncbi:MAG: aromatic ring-hydroxylating dioxygenase subunit alpha [Candidatus Hodarchaeales archaeon]|jgi:phenylpropionate dioxygenase-like ring-hydroxylating dioxygenase large terminal subunit